MPSEAKETTEEKNSIWSVPYVTLMAVNFFQSMAAFMCNTTLPLFADSLGANTAMVGAMVGAFAVSALLVRPFAGPALDSFSRKWLLLIAQAIICVCLFLYGLVTTYEALVIVRLIHGCGIGFTSPLGLSLVSEYLPASKFASGISIYTLAQSLAQVIGPALGLYLVDYAGFSFSYFLAATIIFIAMIGVLFIKEPFRERLPYQLRLSRMFAKEALDKAFALFMLSIPYTCMNAYVVLYGYSRGVGEMGVYFIVYASFLLITRPVFGNLADRIGTPKVLVLGIACFAFGFVLLFMACDLPMFIAAAIFGAAGFASCAPLFQSLALASVPVSRRGSASNTTYTGLDLGNLVGPVLGGIFVEIATMAIGSEAVAYSQLWLVMIIPMFGTLFVVLHWLRAKKNKTNKAK